MIEIDEEDFQLQFPKYSNFLSGLKSDDQFPKLHLSAKLGKLSGSVCTYERVNAKYVGRHVWVSYACRKCRITTGAG